MSQTSEDEDDAPLRRALQALPPEVDPAALGALQRRVLADWSSREDGERARQLASGIAVVAVGRSGNAAWAGVRPGGIGEPGGSDGNAGRRRRWLAVTALVIALVGLYAWTQRPDPVLEELMRMDVLSQMAAGQI